MRLRRHPRLEDSRATAEMLGWPDELLQQHAEATACLVAGGLDRARAAWQAYIAIRRERREGAGVSAGASRVLSGDAARQS